MRASDHTAVRETLVPGPQTRICATAEGQPQWRRPIAANDSVEQWMPAGAWGVAQATSMWSAMSGSAAQRAKELP